MGKGWWNGGMGWWNGGKNKRMVCKNEMNVVMISSIKMVNDFCFCSFLSIYRFQNHKL